MSAEIAASPRQPLIIGSGIAGMLLALCMAPRPVTLLTGARIGAASSTALAQGGIAAALGPDDDLELHIADTIAAGDGLVVPEAARAILKRTGSIVDALIRFGVRFDRNRDGSFQRGLEAAHSRRRILHVDGDATGAAIARALAAAVRGTPSISCLEGVEARRIVTKDGAVCGLLCAKEGQPVILPATQIVLACGGIGGLYSHTTNPSGNFGSGLAMAARAGARLADMEFVQFHPTALDSRTHPLPLLSEAVRGEGAVLRSATGQRLMENIPGGDLAPRDVVARTIAAEIDRGGQVRLDATAAPGTAFAARFPTIAAMLREAGIDPARDPIPVRPAAHYHMGGIATDPSGRTSLQGLWAVGETACTGLHGANRLASNSLLEAAAMALAAAEALPDEPSNRMPRMRPLPLPPAPDPAPVRAIVSRNLGIIRSRDGLLAAMDGLLPLVSGGSPADDPALVGTMIAYAALNRAESRGAHTRSDAPQRLAPVRHTFTLPELFETIGFPPHRLRCHDA